jgi:hypothetical protein
MKAISVDTLPAPAGKEVSPQGEKIKTTIHVGRTIEIGKENCDAIEAQRKLYKQRFGKSLTDNEAVMLMIPDTAEKYARIAELTEEILALISDSD